MRKKGVFFVLFLVLFLLAACGGQAERDFKDAQWGMTMDEVIQLEESNSNSLYEEDSSSYGGGMELRYDDMFINGKEADVVYTFYREVDNYSVIFPETFYKGGVEFFNKLSDDSLSDEEYEQLNDEFEKKNKANIEKIENMPDTFVFDDYLLIEGDYYFRNLDEKDSEELLESLMDTYGEPPYENEGYYRWYTGRTEIYFNGEDYISYTADYLAIEKYIKTNSGVSDL
ncbi:hypothetical protein QGM71_07325 [Virgibacillus sp. C22-A2]|uniref:Lipoprotein n=1 Tax=Virgibacillus tibetensis TaxID=3042313 RepID=A0ABU6KEN1_9BACI|nr:hypothetical protein [Virgibacillus sp. C22-A2]